MNKLFPVFIVMLTLISCNKMTKVDYVVTAKKIYTVDEQFSENEAVAVKDGKVVELGTKAELLSKYKATKMLDFAGKYIYPGFYDAHCHFYGYGMNLMKRCDVTGTKSFEEIVAKLKDFAEKHPENKWIEGRGWDQNDWEDKSFPDKTKLDELFPDKAVFLIRIDGHAALCNSRALEEANIDKNTQVDGGKIELKNGEPSGLLIDNAVDVVYKAIPKSTQKMQQKALLEAQKNCFAVGLTTVDDAGLDYEVIKLIDTLQKQGALKMQVYAMLSPTNENIEKILKKGIYKTSRLTIRSVKMYADGALGSRGAWLKKPYDDDPHNSGLQLTTDSLFNAIARLCYENNYQLNTHAIGDRGVEWVLKNYAHYLKAENDRRWRIEHSQIVAPEDFSLYKKYSIIPSVQPTHATSDMYWAEERIGKERIKGAYAYEKLLEQNGWLCNGSDFPIESINPLFGFYAAVARQDQKGYPKGGFQSENALSREQALKAMTIWAAKSNFEENEKGSLQNGKQADFVVLDTDLMNCEASQLFKAKVTATYIQGEKVF